MKLVLTLFLVLSTLSYAIPTDYSFLNQFEPPKPGYVPERTTRKFADDPAPLNIAMKNYYSDFHQLEELKIYVGGGAEIYYSGWPSAIFNMLESSNKTLNIGMTDLKLTGQVITFKDKKGLKVRVTIGDERAEFVNSFSNSNVVVYLGHSRYGRGPAFKQMWNYFRLGNVFPIIEVPTDTPAFSKEPLQETETYPALSTQIGGKPYQYQYMGQKDHSSYLPSTSFTKRIEGGPKELETTEWLEGKQLVFLFSCSNVHYFREPLRDLHSDPNEKLFFGTLRDAGGVLTGVSVFITSLVQELPTSIDIIRELDKVEPLFTAY